MTDKGKSPAFRFYAADWLSDEQVTVMSAEAEGIFIRLLAYQWLHRSIPNDPRGLIAASKVRDWDAAWAQVKHCFRAVPGDKSRLYNARLEAERDKQAQFSAKMSAAGREGGLKSGQTRTKAKKPRSSNAQAMPEPASSVDGSAKPNLSLSLSLSEPTKVNDQTLVTQPPAASPKRSTSLVKTRSYEALKQHLSEALAEVETGSLRRENKEAIRLMAGELVFAYWQAKLNHTKTFYSPEREKLMLKALGQNGDDVSELLYVIDGCMRDDWAMGRDPRQTRAYHEFEYLFRNRQNIERFRDMAHGFKQGIPHPMAVRYGMAEAPPAPAVAGGA